MKVINLQLFKCVDGLVSLRGELIGFSFIDSLILIHKSWTYDNIHYDLIGTINLILYQQTIT